MTTTHVKTRLLAIYVAIFLLITPGRLTATIFKGKSQVSQLIAGTGIYDSTVFIEESNLIVVDNSLTSKISKATFLTFDNNPTLTSFSATSLEPLSSLSHLTIMQSSLNLLPKIQAVNSTLTSLVIHGCEMTSIPSSAFENMDRLTSLEIRSCPLTTFPDLSATKALSSLTLEHTTITTIPAAYLPQSVTDFVVAHNVGTVSLVRLMTNMPEVTSLYLVSNTLTAHMDAVLEGCVQLDSLNAGQNQLTSFPNLNGCVETIKTLILDWNSITAIPDDIEHMVSLEFLNMNHNLLTSLPTAFKHLERLIVLYVSGNNFMITLNIWSPAALVFTASYANMSSFPVTSNAPKVSALHLSHNTIEKVYPSSFTGDQSVDTIGLDNNKLTSFPPIAILRNLTTLYLAVNRIEAVLWSDANPQDLVVSDLPLQHLKLSENPNLNLSDTSFWQRLTNLEQLTVDKCDITGIPHFLKGLGKLKQLSMRTNQLEYLPHDILSTLTSLESADFTANQLKSISSSAFKAMEHLKFVGLYSNDLVTLGSVINPSWSNFYVDIGDNPLRCDWTLCWIKTETTSSLMVQVSSTPCTAPENLTSTAWSTITEEALNCGGESERFAVVFLNTFIHIQ